MCDPLLAAGAAMTLGGGLLQANAQASANSAANAATAAEQARQRGLEQQSNQLWANNLKGNYSNLPADVNKAAVARQSAYNAAMPAASNGSNYVPGTTPPPSIIGNDAASRAASGNAATATATAAKAKLGSLGDLLFNTDISTARTGQGIAAIGGEQNRSQNILPLELQAAELKARSPWGSLLTTVGGLGLNAYALSNMGNAATDPMAYTGQGRGWKPSQGSLVPSKGLLSTITPSNGISAFFDPMTWGN